MSHFNAANAGVVHALEVFKAAMVVYDADGNVETSLLGSLLCGISHLLRGF